MMFMAIDLIGIGLVITAVFGGLGGLLTIWVGYKLKEVKVDVAAVKNDVTEVKKVTGKVLELSNGNMGVALETNVISAYALAAAQPTPVNIEKVVAAETKLTAHNDSKKEPLTTSPTQQA